jgi:hypothetical protein
MFFELLKEQRSSRTVDATTIDTTDDSEKIPYRAR